jgi:hypothetical protein
LALETEPWSELCRYCDSKWSTCLEPECS